MLNIPEKVFLKSLVGCTKKALAEFKTGEQKTKNKNEFILDYGNFILHFQIIYVLMNKLKKKRIGIERKQNIIFFLCLFRVHLH